MERGPSVLSDKAIHPKKEEKRRKEKLQLDLHTDGNQLCICFCFCFFFSCARNQITLGDLALLGKY